jgi:hypothetical protein
MRRSKTIYFIFLVLFIIGCQEFETIENNSDIEKAKSWFQLNEVYLSKPVGHTTARSQTPIKKVPDWNKSKVHTSKNGMKAVEVVLDYETLLILSDAEIESANPNVLNTMLLFEVRPGEYEVYLLKIFPEDIHTKLTNEDFSSVNYGETPTSFSGRMMIFDWDENFIGGWKITQGEKTKHIIRTQANQKPNGRASRTSQVLCYETSTYWYQIVCVPSTGYCTDPVLIDVISVIECEMIIAPPDFTDPGGGGGGGEGADCYEPHPFIEDLMVPCEEEESCGNGFVMNVEGECYCPDFMEVVNEKCTFRCLEGSIRNSAGNCVPVCNTEDEILNAIQGKLDDLWKKSNASNTSIPMKDRRENGGWIVNGPRGYSIVPFPSTWVMTPCGIDGILNPEDIPANLVGMIHTHPFYRGEDTRGVCGSGKNEGEESYVGGPSDPDAELLYIIAKQTSNFGLKGYVIDGDNIHAFNALGSFTGQFTTTSRCSY